MPPKQLTKLQRQQQRERSRRDTRVRLIKKYRPLCVSRSFIEYAYKQQWDDETTDAAALVLHRWFVMRKKFNDDGWVPMPYQVFAGMFGADYMRIRDHLVGIGFLEYDKIRKYKKGSHCSHYRICSELRDDRISASYRLTSKKMQERFIENKEYWTHMSKAKRKEMIVETMANTFAVPCCRSIRGLRRCSTARI